MSTLLLILIVILIIGAVPAWPYARNWGYAPLGLIVVILLIVLLLRGHL